LIFRQCPLVVTATMFQLPSNWAPLAGGAEQRIAKAANKRRRMPKSVKTTLLDAEFNEKKGGCGQVLSPTDNDGHCRAGGDCGVRDNEDGGHGP
jgi:hypothetical protein